MENIDYATLVAVVDEIITRRDSHDHDHLITVSKISVKIGELMSRFTPHEMEMLKWGSILHDAGKMFVNPDLLNLPRKLSSAERTEMELHTVFGRDFAENMECDPIVVDIIHHHHCNMDGSGYPRSRNDCSIFARIVRAVDAYDAMRNERAYKTPMTHEEAMMLLEAEAGTIFDPEVILFLKLAIAELDKENE
jgi:putative nucleotidyltransferase with HDIG domain